MKKDRPLSSVNIEIPFHPWVYFALFLSSNTLLSYFPLSFQTRLWVGVLGLILPFAVALWSLLEKRLKNHVSAEPFSFENLASPWKPAWFPFLFMVFLFFLAWTRFFHLATLPFWPLGDEGINSMQALGLMKKWNWSPLWGEWCNESLLVWSLAFFFKCAGPSLFALRLFTALLSVATAGLAYWASRQFFPRSFSWVFSWLLAFSFPQLLLARQCTPNDWIPPFQFLAFGLLGLVLKNTGGKTRGMGLLALTLCCGLGFYAYVNWLVVYFFVAVVLLMHFRQKLWGTAFILATFLMAVPLILARLEPGAILLKPAYAPLPVFHSLILYADGVFWDGLPSYPLGPLWGGLLDPVTGSLLLLGLLRIIGFFRRSWVFWAALGLLSSLLPGILTASMELQRITPATPWLLGIATVGFFCLADFRWKFQKAGLALCLVAPLFLNIYNFAGPYCDIRRAPPGQQWRTPESAHAFGILQREMGQNGPLYVFSEFNIFYDDKTLNLACYPFDALQNPGLSGIRPREIALLLNVHYSPFLQKRFPLLRYERLGEDSPLGLYLVPTSQIPPSTLELWVQADQVYRDLNNAIKNKKPSQSWADYSAPLKPLEVRDRSEPLLMSVYWEKVAFFKDLVGDYPGAAEAYQKAAEEGYPAAHLYYDRGTALQKMGKTTESGKAFKKAADLSKIPGA